MNSNSLLNGVFSQRTLKDILAHGKSEILNNAYRTYCNNNNEATSELEKLQFLYSILSERYRNEYYYKNNIINNLLIGRHSVNTTTALAELSINKSKADIVLINGKAIVYEIKTEFDTLKRLENQIFDYYKVFNYVEVLTDEKHLEQLISLYNDTSIGISILNKRNNISSIKKPIENNSYLNHESLYKVLRKSERINLINRYYGNVPEFNQFSEFKELYKLFRTINMSYLHPNFLKELKKRNNFKGQKETLNSIPYHIKSLAYFSAFNSKDFREMSDIMKEI